MSAVVEDEVNERIGRVVAAVRGERSQQSVADAMKELGHDKWSQSTVWAVEKGTRPLRLAEATNLAIVLRCLVADFLRVPDEVSARREVRGTINRIESEYRTAVAALVEVIGWQEVLSDDLAYLHEKGYEIDVDTPRSFGALASLVAAAQENTPENALEAARVKHQVNRDELAEFTAGLRKGDDDGNS